MSKLLDVAMIVKNEAENLPACLESLKALEPILGGIYIYDTGSSDGTQDIARSYGATVQQGYWDDDFSRARNEAIEMCESKWVLIVDADDRVTSDHPALLRHLLNAKPDLDAFVTQIQLSLDASTTGQLQSVRIIRKSRLRYVGTVHEMPRRPDGKPRIEGNIHSSILSIYHAGYTHESLPQKLERNLRLAMTESAKARLNGDSESLCRALIDQARSLWSLGRSDDALACYHELAQHDLPGPYFTWGLELYIEALIASRMVEDAPKIIERIQARGSTADRVSLFKAQVHLLREEYGDSLHLIRTVNINQAAVQLTHNTSTIIHTRMMAALHSDEYEEALACLLQLTVSHRMASTPTISLLLKLWAPRPAGSLTEILSDAPADFIPQIAQELAAQDGIGPEVAQSLLSRVEPALSGVPVTT